MKFPKIGDEVYVPTSLHISRGSDDFIGGLATVVGVKDEGWITVSENPRVSYNWKYLIRIQDRLKAEFGEERAYPSPDVDAPWIQNGDIVDGKEYKGAPIW